MLIRRCAVARPSTKSCALLWFFTKIFSCQVPGPGAVKCVVQRQAVPGGSVVVPLVLSTVLSNWSGAHGAVHGSGAEPEGGRVVQTCCRSQPLWPPPDVATDRPPSPPLP